MAEIRLTAREQQVLRHVRMGASNKSIAEDLKIGEQAVKALVSRLLLKYGAPNRTTLAAMAGARAPGASAAARSLGDALAQSRALREQNRELMDQLRVALRDFGRSRQDLRARIGLNGPRRAPAPSRSPRARRGP